MNDYNEISDDYAKAHQKPDMKYSMVPTVMNMLGSLDGKEVVDVGCGDGYFTAEFAKFAKFVYGIDNSEEQIKKAVARGNVKYVLVDMCKFSYPEIDIIFSPFVLNYLQSTGELESLFGKFYDALVPGGRYAGIIDMPQSTVHDNRRFGSVKRLARLAEGEPMDVELFNGEEHITTLHSFYHTKETVEELLKGVGFEDIAWHTPVISTLGLEEMGEEFWDSYVENCDLAYFSVKKYS
jgi:toxoflavin synthase